MKNRRFAIKALLILVIVIALSIIFSGTITAILTPKVRFVSARNGKLNRSLTLTGTLTYTKTEEILCPGEGDSYTVSQVYVRAGDEVEEGQLLFSLRLKDEDEKRATLEEAYRQALNEKTEFERKNMQMTLSAREESYAEAYAAWRKAVIEEADATRKAGKLCAEMGWTLPEKGLPEGADETVLPVFDARDAAIKTLNETQNAFRAYSRYSIDDAAWNYITEKQAAEEKVREAEEKLNAFEAGVTQLDNIAAPHDGIIAQVNVKTRDEYDGHSPLAVMTAKDGEPTLECILTDSDTRISKGDVLQVETLRDGKVKSKVTSLGYNKDGQKCVYANVTKAVTEGFGGLGGMSGVEIKCVFSVQIASSATLIPASAVHGAEDDRYVFVVSASETALGSSKMTVTKMQVTVLGEADGVAAIEEDISYSRIAYMEDRELSDGSRVMEYIQ